MKPTGAENLALLAFGDTVVLWYVNQETAGYVVSAACDLLVSGVGGTALRQLPAISDQSRRHRGSCRVGSRARRPGAARYPRDSPEAQRGGPTARVAGILSAAISPRDFTSWVHQQFGHDGLDLAEHLVHLDDVYDVK